MGDVCNLHRDHSYVFDVLEVADVVHSNLWNIQEPAGVDSVYCRDGVFFVHDSKDFLLKLTMEG